MGRFDREQHLKPLLAVIVILVLFCGGWLYHGHQQNLVRLDRKINTANKELAQLGIKLQEYQDLETQLRQLQPASASGKRSSLISLVEDAAAQISARSQLIYVRPQPDKTRDDLIEEGVEIKLEKLQLHQLVELLYQFNQADQNLKIAQLRLRTRFEAPELLDTAIILSRFKEKS